MRRRLAAAAAFSVLGAAGTAAAKPVIHDPVVVEEPATLVVAVDPAPPVPPPPPPEPIAIAQPPEPVYEQPYTYPDYVPPPEDAYPRESAFLMAGAVQGWISDRAGLSEFGGGGSLTLGFVQRDGDFPTGADLSAILVRGEGGAVYDLRARVIGSPKIGKKILVPYAAIGLCAGASRIEGDGEVALGTTGSDDASWGLALGPAAAIGLHGFLSDKLYWRAEGGFLGAGAGLYTADLSIGLVMGD